MSSPSTVNVMIASPLEDKYIQAIAAIDPRVRVLHRPDLHGRIRFASDHDGEPFTRTSAQQAEWEAMLAEAEVLWDFDRRNPTDFPRRAPRLKLIYACSSGVTSWLRRSGLAETPIRLCNAAGIHRIPMTEWAMAAMLHFAKGVATLQANQRRHLWQRFTARELHGATLGLLGMGAAAADMARRARQFGMRILLHRRRPDAPLPPGVEVDAVYPRERLREMLAQSDYLLIMVPDSPETERMIGAAELAALPGHAVIVNLGRGTVIDEAAMIAALGAGRLGGAALDVFEKEPLPADSPLWDMANVLISPHNISQSDLENDRQVERFGEIMRCYLDGRPLPYEVDKRAGYNPAGSLSA